MRATKTLFLMSALACGSVGCQKAPIREGASARAEAIPAGEEAAIPAGGGGEAQDPGSQQPGTTVNVDDYPRMEEPVQLGFDARNPYCKYAPAGSPPPYVVDVAWDNPQIKRALRNLTPGWRSTFVYGEWKLVYGLESQSGSDTNARKAAIARNFIRVLCGENRDYPEMIQRKLDVINGTAAQNYQDAAQVYAGADELTTVDTNRNLFSQITAPAYDRMRTVMQALHAYKQNNKDILDQFQRDPSLPHMTEYADGYHFGFGDDSHNSNRISESVPPWTHCEMKYMFERFMTSGENAPVSCSDGWCSCDQTCIDSYVDGYLGRNGQESYKTTHCSAEDFEWMYNFRGHKVYQPLWLDSNAFIWNSRRAGAVSNRNKKLAGDPDYYLHPFASRYLASRQALGAYLLYPNEHHQAMINASESGGGPIMYITDRDTDSNGAGNNIADYMLFTDRNGCGDMGPSGDDPASNCNMVEWETAATGTLTTGAADGWSPSMFWQPDMGFMATITGFEDRMARFTQALDRHTNWGPTGYYMMDAQVQLLSNGQPSGDPRPNFVGAYSPIVACSYDISASHNFASGSYSTTMPFEQGATKWMFIMRFRTADYYDERHMQADKPIDFDRHYFNETSLSNDYYHERALDRFGWVPASNIYANIYFVYGAKKLTRADIEAETIDVPPPAGWQPGQAQQ